MTAINSAIVTQPVPLLDALGLAPPPPDTRQRLLRFPLWGQDSGLLSLADIAEVLRVPLGNVLPVPGVPEVVLGICNWRGDMLWLVDFNALSGYPSILEQVGGSLPLTILVVRAQGKAVGLGVSQFQDIERHDLTHLQGAAPGLFPARLYPFIAGVLPGDQGAVLNAAAILAASCWQTS
ncbi:MAG: CheW domain-containing protein [Cyanobacteria bacterium P01_A01_bin.135]